MKFNHKKFEQLAQTISSDNHQVSIFIPTNRAGDGQAAKIHYKNQLNEVVDKLMDATIQENPMTKNEAIGYLSTAYELLDKEDFWNYQSDGLAVFIGKETFDYYSMPVSFKPFNHVSNIFYLRPMLPAITGEERFFILALSQNEVRFFEGAKHSITPVIINDIVPNGMEEAFAEIDVEHPATLQAHGGGNSPIFHGQGGEKDGKTDQIIDYFRQVDKGLMEMLHDEKVPMVIAAVDYLVPMYREISNYKYIVNGHVGGNPENDDPTLLHEKAYGFIKEIADAEKAEKVNEFHDGMRNDKASLSINDIAPAALNGKIETLFVDKVAKPFWGTYLEKDDSIITETSQNKTNACLLNFAAISTYLQGGKVYNVSREEMPHNVSVLNATYRY